ncbi:P-loop containing nucleoside triphosphate hydrolase protein [Pelagophyceae sp. CCMP2097]|nr:P-loop containing nucleoside triphosphate hydrolase protein [Pelagophyceae sp. CCMP2097]
MPVALTQRSPNVPAAPAAPREAVCVSPTRVPTCPRPQTPTSASKAAAEPMFDMIFSPPPPPGRKTVAFMCGAAPGRDRAFGAGSADAVADALDVERRKMERYQQLALSASKNNQCSSPAPWRLLPRRQTLTPGDNESREAKRYLAALRLQTLLHHRRAERARVKTLQLERAQRERVELDRTTRRAAMQSPSAAAFADDAALRAALRRAADLEAELADVLVARARGEATLQRQLATAKAAAVAAQEAAAVAAQEAQEAAAVAAQEAAADAEAQLALARALTDTAPADSVLQGEVDRLRDEAALQSEFLAQAAVRAASAEAALAEAQAAMAQLAEAETKRNDLAAVRADLAAERFTVAEAHAAEALLAADEAMAAAQAASKAQAHAEAERERISRTAQDEVDRANAEAVAATTAARADVAAAVAAATASSSGAVAAALAAEGLLATSQRQFDLDRGGWDGVRRKLHNRVVELQGNIRVFVRVRPALDAAAQGPARAAGAGGEMAVHCPATSAHSSGDQVEVPETVAPGGPPRKARTFKFAFDRVLPPDTSQADVFEDVRPFAQSALDGYRVCVFAYGQTGSGKTHTVFGTAAQPGLLRRSLDLVFAGAQHLEETQGWKFELTVEMLEVYTEKVYDLFASDTGAPKALTVRDTGDDIVVDGQRRERVLTVDAALDLLGAATKRRHTNATRSNAKSSRSHAIFALRVSGAHPSGEVRHGVLNLVDLAGSERLSVSGSNEDPQLLKEAQSINSSLSSLGNTIAALAQGKGAHVPFRDSRLTFLLQPCLGGDAKTLAIFCLAPELKHERETLCTLRFGQKVSKCQPKGVCAKCGCRAVSAA